eukprot:CAMPEP_0202015616 /NCGR_PEP_ID=MMETSP0905-20130828/32401_1 /ASSEMBLY_ACC=CAM_ASM_000554 /TAXON_ID=420261 /ORGANISM="Thalassiosira antarctica, Strain CCMP982" /LENGTH=138 /DNA_ID=CAMNT_0048575809 /DNA_START=135 /DNA_END=548 /DNA_ORIENTATION=+
MLDAKFRGRLRRLVASRHLASFSTAVSCAEIRSADGRFVASFFFAAFSAPVGCTEMLVTSTFITSWKCASSAAPMSNTKPGGALCAFRTPFSLALAVTAVFGAVRAFRDGKPSASLNATWLSIIESKQARIHRLCIHN